MDASSHAQLSRWEAHKAMTSGTRKMQPWQVFHAARIQLGPDVVAHIFNRSKRAAYDWAQDPACTQVRCKSPLELLHTLFERLDEAGRGYVCRAAISYLETALADNSIPPEILEPHPCIDIEILRDFGAVANLKSAIDSHENLETVSEFAAEAKAEIERTLARYAKNKAEEK